MVKNVGTVDKIVAILMFFTAITGYCVPCQVLGISTCPTGGKK
jgi:hypothetical protein